MCFLNTDLAKAERTLKHVFNVVSPAIAFGMPLRNQARATMLNDEDDRVANLEGVAKGT